MPRAVRLSSRDPLVAFDRVDSLLNDAIRKLNVGEDAVPKQRFVDQLIVPAYSVAIARLLKDRGVQFSVHGRGWDCFDDLENRWRGPVNDREDLSRIISSSRTLIHAIPSSCAHPIDFVGRPVARYAGGGTAGFIQATQTPTTQRRCPALTLHQVARLAMQDQSGSRV